MNQNTGAENQAASREELMEQGRQVVRNRLDNPTSEEVYWHFTQGFGYVDPMFVVMRNGYTREQLENSELSRL